MTREELDRWELERKLLEDLLVKVEQAETAILTKLRCPTNPLALYEIFNGERVKRWTRKTGARDRARAKHALYALLFVAETRRSLKLNDARPLAAARAALLAGLYANDAAANAALAENSKKGGLTRGGQKTDEALHLDAIHGVQELARDWKRSGNEGELQAEHRSAASYAHAQEPERGSLRTVQRRITVPKAQNRGR